MSKLNDDHKVEVNHERAEEPKSSHGHENINDDCDTESQVSETQAGVKKLEAISKTWTSTGLIIAYVTLLLIANATSLEVQVTSVMGSYATSSFGEHSLIATIYVVQSVVNSVIKPPMGKIADVFGRLESFCTSILLYTIGYIMQASSQNVQTFAGAQIFYSAGNQGLQILQQIFVADTTDLLNRALFSTLFDVPFLWTVWAGPEAAQRILETTTWRWGYGMWAIILPVVFTPLAVILFLNQRRAKRQGLAVPSPLHGKSALEIIKNFWYDMDLFGLLLFATAISLILLPLTLAPRASRGWETPSMIAMLVIGGVFLLLFPFWENSKRLTPRPFFPPALFKSKTVIAGNLIAFFYFMAFYLSVFPYFYSYLVIVQHKSTAAAGHITQVFSFTSTVSSIAVSFMIKYTAHYKYFITAGACIYLMGMGIMFHYRNEGASTGTLIGTQLVIGIGGGMLNVPTQLGVQASASHQQVALATAVWLTILEVGGAVGNAVSGAIWSSNVLPKLRQYLPEASVGSAELIYGSINYSGNYTLYPVGSPERVAINRSYQETMKLLLTAAVIVAAPIIPLSLLMKNYKLDQMDQKVEGKVIGDTKKGDERRRSIWGR
ncbi:uncharacterized protein PV09_06627 [Verruconis gallopava]|uniref:Major facilitator superfamily (MFS) profile domain-containing protein n=1 Tax=Verruconis gallopava TaxID=253628 RepID=A0A0D1XIJ1_9PEZI|nr:uncharacterized protein PV09_06627 [Verruconis gallopava]KIW02141.1 hypothetical protein PV09_06627 [Verruconis gallopava]